MVFGCVFQFSDDGRLLKRIGAKGEGPGEYNSVGDFSVTDGKIYIKDVSLSKILEFSINGDFIKETKNLFGQADFTIQNEFQLWYLNNSPNYDFRIMRLSTDGKITPYLNYDDWMANKSVKNPNGFVFNNRMDTFLYQLPLTYSVLLFDGKGYLQETVSFDFGNKNFKLEDRTRFKHQWEYHQFAQDNFLVEGITNFLATESGFLSILTEGNDRTHYIFLNSDFEVVRQANELVNDFDGLDLGLVPWSSFGNEIFCVSSSNEIVAAYKEKYGEIATDESKVPPGSLHQFVFSNRDFLQQENTVLVKLTLKEDLN
jgi:hypothetical protein